MGDFCVPEHRRPQEEDSLAARGELATRLAHAAAPRLPVSDAASDGSGRPAGVPRLRLPTSFDTFQGKIGPGGKVSFSSADAAFEAFTAAGAPLVEAAPPEFPGPAEAAAEVGITSIITLGKQLLNMTANLL